jgi:hypothetical protein
MASDETKVRNDLLLTHLNQALGHSKLPPQEIQTLMRQATQSFQCDAACERKKEIARLKQEWVKSESQAGEKLKQQIEDNRKNFFLAVKGPTFYRSNVLKPEYQAEIDTFIKQQQSDLSKIQISNTRTINAYTATISSLDRIKQLYNDVNNKNTSLKREIDRKEKTTNTAERRVYYEFQEMDKLEYYNKIIKIIYLVVVALYTVLSLYYISGQYKKFGFWGFVLIATAIPFVLPIATRFILSHLNY